MTASAVIGRATIPDVPPDDGTAARIARTTHRLRIVASCAALTALAFLQAPGQIVGDTKVDLAVDPGFLLGRSLHLWDPSGSFGQVQNQAYGYLWPMGPFFVLGDLSGLPSWAVQRLWWALVLCVAFLGVVRLAGRLGIGTPPTRIVAGLAFALAPRFLTSLGPISIEAWPSALAPWVLLPLVGVVYGASLWRSAARSAIAIACIGGVNAAAAAAALPLAALWILTLQPRRTAFKLGVWWVLFTALATFWWVGPLLLLGEYSPPFLNFIETATATTFPTHLAEVVRGTSHWVAYLADGSGPIWFAGWLMVANPIIIIDTVLLTVLGLLGLARPGLPYRRWLLSGVLLGIACVTFGHVGAVDGLFAGEQRTLLDGVLAPLRNVHKYDVILRLPLALGLAHMFGLLGRAAAGWRSRQKMYEAAPVSRRGLRLVLRPVMLYALAIVALLGTATPALARAIPTRGSYENVPSYWKDAAGWLDNRPEQGTVLVAPASNFGDYYWGRTTDEVLQPLLRRPWAVRNAIPLAPPGTIRMLDAIEQRIANGEGSTGLADVLARAGVKYVFLRNDLDYGATGAARPILVHQALSRSPGITYVRGFGADIGGSTVFARYVDQGLDRPLPAVEVYEVKRPAERAVAYPVSGVTTVVGGPESLLQLAEAGQLGPGPAVLAGDQPEGLATFRTALTDGLRRREVAFGQLHGASATMTANEPFRLDAPTHDYLPSWAEGAQTVAKYVGVDSVEASSSRSDASTFGGPLPEHMPYAAIDGDPNTAWHSDPGRSPEGQWLRVRFSKPIKISELGVTFDQSVGPALGRIRVTTDQSSVESSVGGQTTAVVLPDNETTKTLQVTILSTVQQTRAGSVGISSVAIPGFVAGRTLVTPGSAVTRPVLSFSQTAGHPSGCFSADDLTLCGAGVSRPSEDGRTLDRTVRLEQQGAFQAAIKVRPRPGDTLNALLDADRPGIRASASSSSVVDPAGQPAAAVDKDDGTGWTAAAGDKEPSLRLRWNGPRAVTGVRLERADSLAASYPLRVKIITGDITLVVRVDKDGVARFPGPLIIDDLTIAFVAQGFSRSIDPYTRRNQLLPIGVSEVELLGVKDPRVTENWTAVFTLPCGSGPSIFAGGQTIRTAVTANRRELTQLRELAATPCGTPQNVTLGTGQQRILVAGNEMFDVSAATFVPVAPKAEAFPPLLDTEITKWDPTSRSITVPARDEQAVLAVRENINVGWRATLNGQRLNAVTLDGWQQGWVLPAGAGGTVQLSFRPDQLYRGALGIGVLGAAFVGVVAVLPGRRRPRPVTASSGRLLLGLLGGAALVLFGGVWGIGLMALLTVVDALLYWWTSPRFTRLVRWLAPAAGYAAAGLLLALRPWPSPDYLGDDPITQVLVLVTLVTLWMTCGIGEWLAWTTVAAALRRRGNSPQPPEPSPPSSERTAEESSP